MIKILNDVLSAMLCVWNRLESLDIVYRKCSIKCPGRLFKILTFRVGAYLRGALNREGRLLKNVKFVQGKRIFFRNCNDHEMLKQHRITM